MKIFNFIAIFFVFSLNILADNWENPVDLGSSQWQYSRSVAADFDGDGDNDIFVTGDRQILGTYTARLFVNNGLGSFTETTVTNISSISSRINTLASADFNGDSKPDLVLYYSGYTEVFLNDGDGTSFTRQHQYVGVSMVAVDIGDIDGDTDLDFIIIDAGNFGDSGDDRIRKYTNNGSGSFTMDEIEVIGDDDRPVDSPGKINPGSGSVSLFDFDGDNDLDLLSIYNDTGGTIEGVMQTFENNGSGAFSVTATIIDDATSKTYFNVGSNPITIPIDLDRDSDIDFINSVGGSVWEFKNNGSGTFATDKVSQVSGMYDSFGGFAKGDADHDGDTDVLIFGYSQAGYKLIKCINSGSSFVYGTVEDSDKLNGQPVDGFNIYPNTGGVTLADFNGDGKNDMHVFSQYTTSNGLFLTDVPIFYGSLTTNVTTGITNTSATSGGNVELELGDTEVTEHGICWNTTGTPDTDDDKTTEGADASTSFGYISYLTGLTANQVYYVRAYITNSEGTFYGNEISFATIPTLGEWGLIALGSLFALGGGFFVWRKFVVK
jgi:hypothetical protein